MPMGRMIVANKKYNLTWELTVRFGEHVCQFFKDKNIGKGERSEFIRAAVDEKIKGTK